MHRAPGLALTVASVLVTGGGAVRADPVPFDIPAQGLDSALAAFAVASGVQLIYDSALVQGRRSSAVIGDQSPHQALTQMLQGTGITPRYTGPRSITLDGTGAVPAADSVLRTVRIVAPKVVSAQYASVVQRAFRRALEQDPVTRFERFDVILEVWVASDGAIDRVVLRQPTGQASLDEAILRAAQATIIGQPPPQGLPQPVAIGMRARPRPTP